MMFTSSITSADGQECPSEAPLNAEETDKPVEAAEDTERESVDVPRVPLVSAKTVADVVMIAICFSKLK